MYCVRVCAKMFSVRPLACAHKQTHKHTRIASHRNASQRMHDALLIYERLWSFADNIRNARRPPESSGDDATALDGPFILYEITQL